MAIKASKLTRAAVLTAALSLAGCASTPPKPPPTAVLEISEKECHDAVDLSTALPLAPKKPKVWYETAYSFNAETNCLHFQEADVNYMVFELPPNASNHVLTMGGIKKAVRTLAADITLLDENGNIVRTFERHKYMDIGSRFGVQFRPLEGEKYVLVTTRPELVGEEVRAVETNLIVGSGYAAYPNGGGASYNTYSGADRLTSRTFSHEGLLSVRLQALSGKIGEPAKAS